MPLGVSHLATVGFVIGMGTRDGKWVSKPIGTAFRVTVQGEKRLHGYLVTAAHVLWDQEDLTVRFRVPTASGIAWVDEQPLGNVIYEHWDADVAVIPLADREFDMHAIAMERQTVGMDALPQWGQEAYYVGLLDPVFRMGDEAIPMVRSGSVGAMYQTIQPDQDKPGFPAHLIDCRSYRGFSGSPVLVQFGYPGPMTPANTPIPDRLLSDDSTPDVSELGRMQYLTLLLGLLVQHIDDKQVVPIASNVGIGIVLPVDRIWEVLRSEALVKERERVEEETPDPDYQVEDLSAGKRPPSEQGFKRDLKRVTRRLDKPAESDS